LFVSFFKGDVQKRDSKFGKWRSFHQAKSITSDQTVFRGEQNEGNFKTKEISFFGTQ